MLNRSALFAAIDGLASPTGRGSSPVALLLVRKQSLREYEALFGYESSDAMVAAFEARLRESLRNEDRVLQIGECDFAALLPGLSDGNRAVMAAAKVSRMFKEPLNVQGRPVRVRVAVGVAVSADDNAETLCRRADRACTEASRQRERYAVAVTEEIDPAAGYDELHAAILGNVLEVHLQPIHSLADGKLTGFESLARWPGATWRWMSPGVFIPMAERMGLIDALTRWSINATLRHCAPLVARHPGLTCSINLSPVALVAPGFGEQLAAALRIWKMDPRSLIAEVTETAFVEDHETIAQSLSALSETGVGISIDDFGTGYSSLSYLKNFPVTELKVDMSFVGDLLLNTRSARLVASMIDMAHRMEAVAVAEGIEDAETLAVLREMGCDHGQGYYLGRPRPAEEAIAAAMASLERERI